MTLEKTDGSLHDVCIDARMAQAYINDCVEPFAVEYRKEGLECFVCDCATFKQLKYVRMVVEKPLKRTPTRAEKMARKKACTDN